MALAFLVTHIFLPIALILWLAKRTHETQFDAGVHTLFTALFVLFLFMWGQWPMVGSYYLRFILVGLLVLAGYRSLKKAKDLRFFLRQGVGRQLLAGILAALSLVLGTLNVFAIKGHFVSESPVELAFPLRGGTYYVSDGGSNAILNIHYKTLFPAQKYAIDLSKLNEMGLRAKGLFPAELSSYFILGEMIYSPCSGVVVEARDAVGDNTPLQTDEANPLGNNVVLECKGVRVYMYHMMKGSLRVRSGDKIVEGQAISQVGNSGFSQEPHLHIHAARVEEGRPADYVIGVPIAFDGRFLVKNSLITK